jgi:hypothetical protein
MWLSPRASVLALVAGCALIIGCGGNHSLPVMPPGGVAGTAGPAMSGAAGTAGTTASGTAGSGAAGAVATGATAGSTGAATGGAGSTGGAAGSTGAAGSSDGGGGTTGAAGGFMGILGQAGGDGGAPACPQTCPTLACRTDSTPMVDPTFPCCPVCKPVKCASIPCSALTCPADMQPQLDVEQCCSTCVAGTNSLCDQARAQYAALDHSLRDQLSGPCQSDADCTYTAENNGCQSSCFVPVTKAGASKFDTALRDSAGTCNTVCGTPRPITCEQMSVACVQGRCVAKP